MTGDNLNNLTFFSNSSKASLIIEDNGRVGYAYLCDENGSICADVWLYNRCVSPTVPEWSDRDLMPFANPRIYALHADDFLCPQHAQDITVAWNVDPAELEVQIFIRGKLFALLSHGSKPGKSLLATQDGPLAMMLVE